MKILQLTLLVADYMNMMGKTAPGLLPRTSSELNLYELLNIKQTDLFSIKFLGTGGTATPSSATATPKSTTLSRGQPSRASSRGRLNNATPCVDQVLKNKAFTKNLNIQFLFFNFSPFKGASVQLQIRQDPTAAPLIVICWLQEGAMLTF